MMNMNEPAMIKLLESKIPPRRVQHCLNVAQVARELAEKYGVDPDKAYVIGLLHDYAKGIAAPELLIIAIDNQLLTDEIERRMPEVLHAPVGAYLLETELGIDDPEMLQAVKVHTLGSLQMSTLDKIIFLADMIEPGRDFPGLDRIQCLAGQNLDRAMLAALDEIIRDQMDRGRILHPLSILVRNKFIDNIKEQEETC